MKKTAAYKTKDVILTCIFPALAAFGWGGLIASLSSENGEQTAQTSRKISVAVAHIVTDSPTEETIAVADRYVRTTAHFVLFFVLGVLIYGALYGLRIWLNKYLLGSIAVFLCGGFSYWDEWRKQFIEGRHFQLDEAALNFAGGLSGILALAVVLCGIRRWRSSRKKKKEKACLQE